MPLLSAAAIRRPPARRAADRRRGVQHGPTEGAAGIDTAQRLALEAPALCRRPALSSRDGRAPQPGSSAVPAPRVACGAAAAGGGQSVAAAAAARSGQVRRHGHVRRRRPPGTRSPTERWCDLW